MAVRQLRERLGESQQQFAFRMKTAIRTIARYEGTRPPKGKALAEFERVALENGAEEYAQVFRTALAEELGVSAPNVQPRASSPFRVEPILEFKNADERSYVAALLLVMRSADFVKERQVVLKKLAGPLANMFRHQQSLQALLDSVAAMGRLIREGKSVDEVAAAFDVRREYLEQLMAVYDARTNAIRTNDAREIVLALLLSSCLLAGDIEDAGRALNVPVFAMEALLSIAEAVAAHQGETK
jgi:transcriptional regulator with XRE-family HTH domain